ncbi:hypothetical protein [Streptomyces vilmorinianum]|uniref:hypothetical protein n=1 Tax=Streptomyces vilmorinianum TaxID=3051092 RepID=UPI0020C76CA7|nr:hypothetical protein [Streptomyces vilmorinianum]
MNIGCPTCPDLSTLGDVVYDAGMLIALATPRPGLTTPRHREFGLHGLPVVPAPVIAQAWRGGTSKAHLARALKDCAVICCYTEAEWRRVGELIGEASLPSKKRPDPLDGLVALTATQVGAAAVATSDPDDIQAYLDVLPGGHSVLPLRV